MERRAEISAALRQIGRGFEALADAVTGEAAPEAERVQALLHEWDDRGLTRVESSALFRKHGFAPQAAGGWTRGDWIRGGDDGLRYLTDRSRRWLAEQEDHDG